MSDLRPSILNLATRGFLALLLAFVGVFAARLVSLNAKTPYIVLCVASFLGAFWMLATIMIPRVRRLPIEQVILPLFLPSGCRDLANYAETQQVLSLVFGGLSVLTGLVSVVWLAFKLKRSGQSS